MTTQEIQDAIQKRLEKEAGLFDYSGELSVDISTAGGKVDVTLKKKLYHRCIFIDIKSDLTETNDTIYIQMQNRGKGKSHLSKAAAKYIMTAIKDRNKIVYK